MRHLPLLATIATMAGAALAPAIVASAEPPRLAVYNWSDYIAPDTIANFEKATGIKVTYDVYDANEVLEAKLLAGGSGYDVVVPSASPFLARQIKAGVYRTLDKSKLPNWKNLDPKILSLVAAADPGNAHAAPYLWSVTGIGWNKAMVQKALGDTAPTDSWSLIFDAGNAKKLAGCGISVLDSPGDVFPAMLAWLGRDPLSTDTGDLDRAVAALQKIRPYIRKFHSSEYINDLANGDLCLSLGYSGDVIQARNRAREAKNGIALTFAAPKEGAEMAVDMLAIPADAPDPENALKYIDYILRPAVIAGITNAVSYPNPNLAATPLVKEAIRDDPQVYPPDAVRGRFFVVTPAPADYERARTRAWTRLKTGD